MRLEEIEDTGGFFVGGYGEGGFRVSRKRYEGSLLILPSALHSWSPTNVQDISLENLLPLIEAADEVEILLIGCGTGMARVATTLCDTLREQHGISVDFMDTGAACRTFNVLRVDGRAVAAALIAV
ncbi:MAG: MTH938/NDUFAF3 family protein [Proteobacteria bacterium]|nr:MTH938/NDUFAF3 family protein [Pseudomonadota bacterium]